MILMKIFWVKLKNKIPKEGECKYNKIRKKV